MRLLVGLSSILLLAGACGASADDGAAAVEGAPYVEEKAESAAAVSTSTAATDRAPIETGSAAETGAAVDTDSGVAGNPAVVIDPRLVDCGDAIDTVIGTLDATVEDFNDRFSAAVSDPAGPVAMSCLVLTNPATSGLAESEVYNYMLARFPIEVLAALAEVLERAPADEILE